MSPPCAALDCLFLREGTRRPSRGSLRSGTAADDAVVGSQNLRWDLCLTMYLQRPPRERVTERHFLSRTETKGYSTEVEGEARATVTPVQGFPEAQEDGSVQMAPVTAQLQDGHVPLLDVGVRLCFVVLQVKGSNWQEWTSRQVYTEHKRIFKRVDSLITRGKTHNTVNTHTLVCGLFKTQLFCRWQNYF